MAYTEEELKKELETKEYEYGFYTDIESDTFPVGLNEEEDGSLQHCSIESGCLDMIFTEFLGITSRI